MMKIKTLTDLWCLFSFYPDCLKYYIISIDTENVIYNHHDMDKFIFDHDDDYIVDNFEISKDSYSNNIVLNIVIKENKK